MCMYIGCQISSALTFVYPICLLLMFDCVQRTLGKVGCGSFEAGTKDVQHSSESADDAEDGSMAFQIAVSITTPLLTL